MFVPPSAHIASLRAFGRALLGAAPNRWDIVLLPLVLATLFLAAWGSSQMAVPFTPGQVLKISLDPAAPPFYALRTTLRMAAAMLASVALTPIYGTLAAKRGRAGSVLVPLLDILQSVPILGFLRLFPGNLLGPEAAAIFAIFTS